MGGTRFRVNVNEIRRDGAKKLSASEASSRVRRSQPRMCAVEVHERRMLLEATLRNPALRHNVAIPCRCVSWSVSTGSTEMEFRGHGRSVLRERYLSRRPDPLPRPLSSARRAAGNGESYSAKNEQRLIGHLSVAGDDTDKQRWRG